MGEKGEAIVESTIIELSERNIDPAENLLASAFKNDPMFQAFFIGNDRLLHIRLFFDFVLKKGLSLKEKVVGLVKEDKLVGVASIELPTSVQGIKMLLRPAFIMQVMKFMFAMPKESFTFINQYMKATSSVRPKLPHHYLVFIGIDPEFQGTGNGKKLLHHIHEIVDKDPESIGIGLDTENPENVQLYGRFGYRKVAERKIGDLTIYCMFRPKKEPDAELLPEEPTRK